MEDDRNGCCPIQIDQWVGSCCSSAKFSQDNSASSKKSPDIKQGLKRKIHKVPIWKHTLRLTVTA